MQIKGIISEDFINYKKPAMVIEFPRCDFKCDKEYGCQICQNGVLATTPEITIAVDDLVLGYCENEITQAIICQGLEPFDSWDDLFLLIAKLRKQTLDDIIIYTGYNKNEIEEKILILKTFPNIIIKYGRYIPDQAPHYDDILGVKLASDNQYAEKIS